MTFKHYPTASEVRLRFHLDIIYNKIEASRDGFIDAIISNETATFLKERGFSLFDIRYEYGVAGGFHGRTDGDGRCLTRIIWGDVEYCMRQYGYFKP